MTIRLLTPDQARTAGQELARAMASFKKALDQLLAWARRLAESAFQLARALARHAREHTVTGRRPAWATPYGPAPCRTRR